MSYNNITTKPYVDQKNWSNTYLTDPKLIELLGPFDTDPCTPNTMPWVTANIMYNETHNGLNQEWNGRVWMNPPYRGVMKWAEKFIESDSGIALLNGRSTETKATQLIMNNSVVIWFPGKRLTWFKETGEPYDSKWFGSILIGLDWVDDEAIKKAQAIYGGQVFYK